MQENGSDFTLSKPTEGVKLSGTRISGRNCRWIVSLETSVSKTEAEGANDAEDVLNLSGKRTEDALSSPLIHMNYMNSIF